MKKLITTAAFVMFGTMMITAQTTQKKNSIKKAEKPVNSTEMKMDTSVQPNGMNRTVDTATMDNKTKMQENPNRIQQDQKLQNNGTLESPNTTMPNNGTLQNPNTMPNNSTATPQVQPVSPVDATKTTR